MAKLSWSDFKINGKNHRGRNLMIWNLLIAVGVVALGYVGGRWLYQKDTEKEERRRAAFKAAAGLQNQGLNVAADFLVDYAVGDYSGMAKKLKDVAVVLSNPAAAQAEFANVFSKILQAKLNDPVELAKIAEAVASKQVPKS
jgi:hypothetical protein